MDLICRYCSRLCKSKNSLAQHELRCSQNPDRRDFHNLSDYIRNNRKGKTKDTCPEIAQQVSTMAARYANGYVSPLIGRKIANPHSHSAETRAKIGKRVSETLKARYASGKIKPARGVGRGKYSYIIHGNMKYMFRSTYEFVFALHLIVEHIQFEVEAIRVPAVTPNRYASTFISDFSIGNRVIEIKGIPSGKDKHEKAAFEAAGYIFEELYEADIKAISEDLISKGYDIPDLVEKITAGHNSKCYFEYKI